MFHKIVKHKFWLLAVLVLLVIFLFANVGEINKNLFGVAIDGYDATAYFADKKATIGTKTYFFHWKGAQWNFASEKKRNQFAEDPDKYAPQYGGHCANAMSLGKKIKGIPQIWSILYGKLYLFNAEDGRKRWAYNSEQWIEAADKHWQKLKDI